MGTSGGRACTALDFGLKESLEKLGASLSENATPATVQKAEKRLEDSLEQWSTDAAGYLKNKADEVKEILIVLARVVESSARRDQRYTRQFAEVTARLSSIANLEDITRIRAQLMEGIDELKSYTARMEQESTDSLEELRSEISAYQSKLENTESKLEKAELQASRDTLTGLDNRRAIEGKLDRLVERKQPFCMLMIDLDKFKHINDRYGHQAGDGVLGQFATELRAQFRAGDAVGRWGGDEFIVILQCGPDEAQAYIDRVEKWVFGSYAVQLESGTRKLPVRGSIGLATWTPGETIQDVLRHADAAMYQYKHARRKTKTASAD